MPGATTTGEGSTALGFYNVQQGDVPYFKSLADHYAMSDNFHQSVNGGTGANHIMFGHGDMIWYSDANGNPAAPPNGVRCSRARRIPASSRDRESQSGAGTNNWYTEDGYGRAQHGLSPAVYLAGLRRRLLQRLLGLEQPGVRQIVNYLKLPRPIDPRCEPGHYYLLNNYNPGYFGNGNNAYADQNPANTPFTIPPSSTPSIGDNLNEHHISWKYYGDQWNNYVNDPYQLNYGTAARSG